MRALYEWRIAAFACALIVIGIIVAMASLWGDADEVEVALIDSAKGARGLKP